MNRIVAPHPLFAIHPPLKCIENIYSAPPPFTEMPSEKRRATVSISIL